MNPQSDVAMEKHVYQTSCERCRKRKIKCDRSQPCSKCLKAKVNCTFIGSGEKQRPAPRGYVQALEGQITSLEKFISKLITADTPTRDEMLANFSKSANHFHAPSSKAVSATDNKEAKSEPVPICSRTGHLRRQKDGKASEFYGATSFFQISPAEEHIQTSLAGDEILGINQSQVADDKFNTQQWSNSLVPPLPYGFQGKTDLIASEEQSIFAPKSEICRHLVGKFFEKQYPYFMCLYREVFLMHYDAGGGPYYSDVLLYAICSMGALASEGLRELSDVFFSRAQELLYGFALESPDLTTLQALILMGHREIGMGKSSKGWLLSGMAFRLAHEMGLHLDPNNWTGSDDSRVEREILRRMYWAAFVADKQLSLYFGRPPALYPSESDVTNTIRIPYPPEWEPLLNKYISSGTSQNEFEDGKALVDFFIQQAELCKISHRMITEVFENRNIRTDEIVLAASVKDIQVSLREWASELPAKLHWNEWTVGQVPSLVLYLHMSYHTIMIILHRPPRHLFRDPDTAKNLDVHVCYQSLESIIKLLRAYSRNYQYNHLPVPFVHILASASSVILMKQQIESTHWDDPTIAKPLDIILASVDGISQIWPCAKQVREVIESAMNPPTQNMTQMDTPESFDLMTGLTGMNYDPINFDLGLEMQDIEGLLNPDGFFDDILGWNNTSTLP